MEVVKHVAHIQISEELLADALTFPSWEEIQRAVEERDRAWRALPPEEQARILAEQKAAYEAERCSACGCHPDEHGDC